MESRYGDQGSGWGLMFNGQSLIFGKMRKSWRWGGCLFAQQCECSMPLSCTWENNQRIELYVICTTIKINGPPPHHVCPLPTKFNTTACEPSSWGSLSALLSPWATATWHCPGLLGCELRPCPASGGLSDVFFHAHLLNFWSCQWTFTWTNHDRD